ncbi:MAG: hypothetical protein ACI9H8_001010 [Lysobacterales bacterium]|jgi:hypothetical protein
MRVITISFISLVLSGAVLAGPVMNPTQLEGLEYKVPLLTGSYDEAISKPSSILGFPVGSKTATPAQIVEVITVISDQSDRALLFEYARSHEGRPLYYLVISSPENLAQIDSVKADLARLSDPRGLSESQADSLIERLPAVAWMGFSIHGNETSGADSSLAALYHLTASQDEDVISLLNREIVIIDPSMNPDGRARFSKAVEEVRGAAPNIDNQSMLHTQDWPGGRYNHYLFDLNRDYIHGIHPETRGKVRAINEWHPQIVIDAHEMGSQSTFHFSPAREPVNSNKPPFQDVWMHVFANDQAAAFDSNVWPYFNGENYDDLYPGYTVYSMYRGALNILYEQARVAEDGVRQDEGKILTYRESVHHQLVSTLSSLNTLADNSKQMYRDYFEDRRNVMSSASPLANRSFVVLPSDNGARIKSFVAAMELQGFELYQASSDIQVNNAVNHLGQTLARTTIPEGSIVIPNRQPEARLIATMLEFDTSIRDKTLLKERELILRGTRTLMYDVSAWNTTMLHGLEAWTVPVHLKENLAPYNQQAASAALIDVDNSIAWIVTGGDDYSVGFAARAMETGLKVRVVTTDAVLDGKPYPRGSVVVYRADNPGDVAALKANVEQLAGELGVVAQGFASGTGAGELPDIGGKYFQLLEQPQIAIVTHGTTNPLDVGAIWNSIDRFLGIRHSHLDQKWLGEMDLRRYNVIVLPDLWRKSLSAAAISNLKTWVENGGTLIAIKDSVSELIDPANEFTRVRNISDTFAEPDIYDLAIQREWLWGKDKLENLDQLRSNLAPEKVDYPWQGKKEDESVLKKRDQWQRQFMPKGAITAGRTDQKHWLTFGAGPVLPVLTGVIPVLMADESVDAPVRFGVFSEVDQDRWAEMQKARGDEKGPRKIGWASLPDQYELNLRMSGLIWPEAAQRIANAAYLTRESKGNGQIILFADSPMFRGSSLGTNRLLLNALVYGPGLGASQPIIP